VAFAFKPIKTGKYMAIVIITDNILYVIVVRWDMQYVIFMLNLFLLNENTVSGSNFVFLNIISLSAIICGILVIISKNPIVSVLFLIGLFLSISGYLMMLGINFIGLSYLLVYVGAVSILFLFILMLINVRISELVTDTSNSIPLAVFIGILFNSIVYEILPSYNTPINSSIFNINRYFANILDVNGASPLGYSLKGILNLSNASNEIGFVSSQAWDGNLSETSHITTIGNVIYTSYPIWLIITSIILLLAMVGAIVITIKKK
jgi:NADH-ubiquinone oxidoreductase chain 6